MDESVDGTLGDEVARRAVASARNAAQVLAGYRGWCHERGRGGARWGRSGSGMQVVQAWWRNATDQSRRTVRSLPQIRGARRNRHAARSAPRRTGKLLDDYLAVHRRFRESCAAMPRRDAASWSTELRLRSGRPSWSRNDQRPRSWSPIHAFAATCRIGWQEALAAETERRWLGHEKRHGGAATSLTVAIVAGPALGAPSRYLSACRSTSPMMNRCGLAMRRSIRLSTCKAVAH